MEIHKLYHKKFHLSMRQNFPWRVGEPWNSCPGRVLGLPL